MNYPSFTPIYHHDQYPTINPTQPHLDCSGKNVLITGAGTGIGRAIAVAFAQAHAHGIALVGRTQATLQETANEIASIDRGSKSTVFIYTADITSQSEVEAAFAASKAHFSNQAIDVLVNNAGGMLGSGGAVGDIDILGSFWKTFELNVLGTMIVLQSFIKAFTTTTTSLSKEGKDGPDTKPTIINISSGAAHIPYAPGGVAYCSSKLAAAKVAEFVHHEHPDWNVFNLQPGVVATELARRERRKAPDSPALAAGMAVWLASQPRAGEKLNGRFLWANWDVEEVLANENVQRRDLLRLGLKGGRRIRLWRSLWALRGECIGMLIGMSEVVVVMVVVCV